MKSNKTLKLTNMAMIFRLAMVLSFVESMIMPLFALPPGVKLGLSNIAVMYALVYMGFVPAFQLALLKGLFAFLTRGAIAGMLSGLGGVFSITIMFILQKILGDKVNYYTLSVFGALFHNVGQMTGAAFIFGTAFTLYYLPVLAVSAVIMGVVTGAVLTAVLPALARFKM